MIRTIRSPLISVRLDFLTAFPGEHVGYRREADPIWLLANHSATLQVFAWNSQLHIGSAHAYPHVKLCHARVGTQPLLRPYIASFPSLSTFKFVAPTLPKRAIFELTAIDELWKNTEENATLWDQYRDMNQRDQLLHGTWAGLDTLITNSLVAYTLGLNCHVRRLHLLVHGDVRPSKTISTIRTVLRDTRPSCLRLSFFHPDIPTVLRYLMKRLGYEFQSISALELHLNVVNSLFDMPLFLVSLELSTSSVRTCHANDPTPRMT